MRTRAADPRAGIVAHFFGSLGLSGFWEMARPPCMMKLSRDARAPVGVRWSEEKLCEAVFFRGARVGRFVVAKERMIEGGI